MKRLPLHLLLTAFAVASACSSKGSGPAPPVPPPETGVLTIDMNGLWGVSDIQRIDGSGGPPPGPDPGAIPFLALQPDQEISIWQGQAWDWFANAPLYSVWSPGIGNQRYLNAADGRFWLFDFHFEHTAYFQGQIDCYTNCRIRAAFGTVDATTMDGIVEVFYASSCPAPAVIRPNPNGTFRVRLSRILSQPAGIEPDGEAPRAADAEQKR